MRFLVVAVSVTVALAFFYREQFRHALDELTDVQAIKVAEGEALADAEGREAPAKPAGPAPASATKPKDPQSPPAEKKAAPAKPPAIQPLGAPKRYELPGTDRR